MNRSEHNGKQDIEPLKDKAMEGLPKKFWNRLSDRSKLPRRLWFPPKRHLDLNADEWQRQHDEVSISLRRTMITLLGYSFFCMLTLAAPDVSLIARDAKIKVPFAGTEVSYQAFLTIGPLTMFALAIYLHILLGHWVSLGKHKDTFGLPYIFNIDNKSANWLANFIFYWLPCFVLSFFSWKALPRPNESFLLIIQTAIFFTCMVVFRIRRFPDDQHRFKFNAPYLFVWLLGVCLLLGTQIGFYDRSLDLFKADLGKKDLRDIDLSKANLIDANLIEANLQGANLKDADFGKANLQEANLQNVDLRYAKLQNADLKGAKLQNADLRYAKLQGANLKNANLQGANLKDANLQGANFERANLQQSKLWGAKLQKAVLVDANLQKAYLGDDKHIEEAANLQEANLTGANLKEAILVGANLQQAKLGSAKLNKADIGGANLQKADLNDAELQGTKLWWADLTGCINLTQKQIDSACGNEQTKLPNGLTIKICP
jgi:uncharacterized protein YjbI with pentapeptide repeats